MLLRHSQQQIQQQSVGSQGYKLTDFNISPITRARNNVRARFGVGGNESLEVYVFGGTGGAAGKEVDDPAHKNDGSSMEYDEVMGSWCRGAQMELCV